MINSVDVVIIVSSLLAFVLVSMALSSILILALGWLLARMNDAEDPPNPDSPEIRPGGGRPGKRGE